jgi:hypothetical protein
VVGRGQGAGHGAASSGLTMVKTHRFLRGNGLGASDYAPLHKDQRQEVRIGVLTGEALGAAENGGVEEEGRRES